jgi:hypothetical protein
MSTTTSHFNSSFLYVHYTVSCPLFCLICPLQSLVSTLQSHMSTPQSHVHSSPAPLGLSLRVLLTNILSFLRFSRHEENRNVQLMGPICGDTELSLSFLTDSETLIDIVLDCYHEWSNLGFNERFSQGNIM